MKSYTFSEYRKLQELSNIDRIIGNLKRDRKEYARLVFLLAVTVPKQAFASNDLGLEPVAFEIVNMVLTFGKYGCLGIGLKRMIEEMLAGANLKEATGAGVQYFIFYILMNLYPKLFSMVRF